MRNGHAANEEEVRTSVDHVPVILLEGTYGFCAAAPDLRRRKIIREGCTNTQIVATVPDSL